MPLPRYSRSWLVAAFRASRSVCRSPSNRPARSRGRCPANRSRWRPAGRTHLDRCPGSSTGSRGPPDEVVPVVAVPGPHGRDEARRAQRLRHDLRVNPGRRCRRAAGAGPERRRREVPGRLPSRSLGNDGADTAGADVTVHHRAAQAEGRANDEPLTVPIRWNRRRDLGRPPAPRRDAVARVDPQGLEGPGAGVRPLDRADVQRAGPAARAAGGHGVVRVGLRDQVRQRTSRRSDRRSRSRTVSARAPRRRARRHRWSRSRPRSTGRS